MPLLQRHIDELKRIHLAETGETLSDDELRAMAACLISLTRIILSYGQDSNRPSGNLRSKVDRIRGPSNPID